MKSYLLFQLQKIDDPIRKSFFTLPDDEYIDSIYKFRKRSYSTGLIKSNQLSWTNGKENPFEQSIYVNKYSGNTQRHFSPLSDVVKSYLEKVFFMNVLKYLPSYDYEIGVHQIRVVADSKNMGLPTPEGIHQDGFDYVSILSINNQNITGGTSILLSSENYQDIIFERDLSPGNCLLLNDRRLFHYVSPIVPKLPGICFRDVIVTTFSKKINLAPC